MNRHNRLRALVAARAGLEAEERMEVDAHLTACSECRELSGAYARQDAMLRALPSPPVPRELRTEVHRRVERLPMPRRRPRINLPQARAWPAPAVTAIAVAVVVLAALVHANVVRVPGQQGTSAGWAAGVRLYTLAGGRWRSAKAVESLGDLRGVLTAHGSGLSGRNVRATMTVEHLSWQGPSGVTRMLVPPAVRVTLRRTASSAGWATFIGQVRIPTLLPAEWSVVRFDLTDGQRRIELRSGINVAGVARRTAFNTLTVPKANAFCAARPHFRSIPYLVYLHGYFEGLASVTDGPPEGIVLDRPRHVPSKLPRNGSYAHGIVAGGFGLPKSGTWATVPGSLGCTDGKASGFGVQP